MVEYETFLEDGFVVEVKSRIYTEVLDEEEAKDIFEGNVKTLLLDKDIDTIIPMYMDCRELDIVGPLVKWECVGEFGVLPHGVPHE